MKHKSMRVLVTGGAGFIGSAVCRLLVTNPAMQILNVDKLTYAGNLDSLKPVETCSNYRFVHADIIDLAAMEYIFASFNPDCVLHLAAESHVDRSIADGRAFVDTNIVGAYTLFEVARNYWNALPTGRKDQFRFVHVSTDEVYGSLGEAGLFSEQTPYDPSSPYSASKAAADLLAGAWHRTYGLPVIITNCSNNYGPYQFPEKLIPTIILNALQGKPLPVYGKGENVRDWLYVDDHARALEMILRQGVPGRKYNIGGRNERKNLDVVESICCILDRCKPSETQYRELIKFVSDRPGHDLRYAIDASRIESEIGWRAIETFESGLAKTVEWYIDNEWWWRPILHRK